MPIRFARENFTSGRRRRPISSSMLKVPNKWFATLKNVVNIFFRSEAGSCSKYLDISRSARVDKFIWGRKKYYFLVALRFLVTYLWPVRSQRKDCSRKVKGSWFVPLIFFSIWGSRKLMFWCRTPNSRCATISYFGLIENWLKRSERKTQLPSFRKRCDRHHNHCSSTTTKTTT